MIFRLATWNVNSIRRRIENVERLVKETSPDIICFQETKVEDAKFPISELEALGYKSQLIYGQRSYNGVAICSRHELTDGQRLDWAGKTDARHLSCTISRSVQLHNFYVPAGGDTPDLENNEKFRHKLRFLEELTAWFVKNSLTSAILVGDLNIAPLENDVWSHKQLLNVVSHTPIEVEALNKLMDKGGWADAMRYLIPEPEKLFTWWSYRSPNWKAANRGRRLDHIWVTPDLIEKIQTAWIFTNARDWPIPSDHAPVFIDLEL